MHRCTRLTCHSEERSDVGISCRHCQFVQSLVESNSFKFRHRVKKEKIFPKNTLKFSYCVLYCICKCLMECSSFSSARMGGDDVRYFLI